MDSVRQWIRNVKEVSVGGRDGAPEILIQREIGQLRRPASAVGRSLAGVWSSRGGVLIRQNEAIRTAVLGSIPKVNRKWPFRGSGLEFYTAFTVENRAVGYRNWRASFSHSVKQVCSDHHICVCVSSRLY